MKENTVMNKGVSAKRVHAGNIDKTKNILKSFIVFERLIRYPTNIATLITVMSSEELSSQTLYRNKFQKYF